MGMDHISMTTIMNTVEEFSGQRWIPLAILGHAAAIQVTQSTIPHYDNYY
jgi:hypothetical protein